MRVKQGEATACALRQVDALRLTAFKARLSRQRKKGVDRSRRRPEQLGARAVANATA